ncbi:MAG: hypothetical protein Aurels2KO_37180 [Aureliella sp.]
MPGEVISVSFEEDEQQAILALAEYYEGTSEHCDLAHIKLPNGRDLDWMREFCSRLERLQLVGFRGHTHVTIMLVAASTLKNPKAPDYWAEWYAWWFAARWRTAITVLVVLLPFIVQWIEMIQKILAWLGIS